MGKIGEKLDIDFVVSTGDNFYDNGLTGLNDQAFEESFTKIYTATSLQKQWYSGKSSVHDKINFSPHQMNKPCIYLQALNNYRIRESQIILPPFCFFSIGKS